MQALFLLSRVTDRADTLLPAMGYGLDRHLVLPVLVLALRPMAEIARLTSELLAEELNKEYVRTAISKGLPWRLVVLRHAFPNIATVIAVAVGNSTRYLLSSLIVVELLFGWPGVGKALAGAVAPRLDGRPSAPTLFAPSLVAALVTALAALAVFVNYGTGLVARSIDPRLRD
jgi:peptide/nickel transport system permease protein